MNKAWISDIQHQFAEQRETLKHKLFQAWETHLAPKYHALEEREQRIVAVAALLLPLIIVVFGILLPAADTHARLQAEIKAFSSQVAEAEQLADILEANPKAGNTGQPSSNNMLTLVDKLARESGVRSFMTRLRPQQVMGSSARLQAQIKHVPYAKVVSFLAALAKHNLPLYQLKIQAASAGVVHVQAIIGH